MTKAKKIVPHWANAYGEDEAIASGMQRPADIPPWANAWKPDDKPESEPADAEEDAPAEEPTEEDAPKYPIQNRKQRATKRK